MKGKKNLHRYISNKNIGTLLNEVGNLVTMDMGKAEVLNTFFT